MRYDREFWKAVDELLVSGKIVIDRPRGSHHPRFPEVIYPLDYGYLEGTTSMDGGGIDLWMGSRGEKSVDALIVTVDMLKKDSEIKLLVGMTDEEVQQVLDFHNSSVYMKGILVRREET
jgi:inorganic pyrophosphatase